MRSFRLVGLGFIYSLILINFPIKIYSQKPEPPIPVEAFFGNNTLCSQIVVKKTFTSESQFSFFGIATYSASYENNSHDNSMVMINQISYNFGKGFGIMGGADMNSAVGFSPIVGPQHNYASKTLLAITVVSFFLNGDNDLKIFGLYEYKPEINDRWSLYNRIQFIYNQQLSNNTHNRSYLYLRSGLKRNSFIFGLAANLDQYGPTKHYKDNYGLFVRWELK